MSSADSIVNWSIWEQEELHRQQEELNMKNHWLQEQTERLKPVLTLITDKVIKHGRMIDAHRALY